MNIKKMDIHFRVMPEEKEVIEKAASAAGKNLSDYARDILLAASDYEVTDITWKHTAEKLHSDSGKTKELHIRFSEKELEYYQEQAKIAGCSVSQYIRNSANGNQIIVISGMKEMAKQIAKLGVNINQLATLAHQGRIKEVDMFACNDTLKQILKKLTEIKKG